MMAAVVAWEWAVLVAGALVVMVFASRNQHRRGGRTPAGDGSRELQPVPVRVEEAGRRR